MVCLAVSAGTAFATTFELISPLEISQPAIRYEEGFAQIPSFDRSVNASPGEPAIMWLPFSINWPSNPTAPDPQFLVVESDTLQLALPLAPAQQDIITSDTSTVPAPTLPDPAIYDSDAWFPQSSARIDGVGSLGATGLLTGSWSPLLYHPVSRRLIVIRRAHLTIEDVGSGSPFENPSDVFPLGDALLDAVMVSSESNSAAVLAPAFGGEPSWNLAAGIPTNVEYVVVTKAAFANAVKPLVLWKARKGISAGIATIEDITAQYPGVDPAESVRNYLKASYASGLKWVVIGGDETVAPVRRAYAEFPVYDGDVFKLQQCDLYFAELNGNWDADGDGVWGEFSGDQAQMQPELYVGRLPYSTAAEAQAIVNKIIAYERGPSSTAYLTKSLSVSTDQFRDWSSGTGQHGVVAGSMPAGWTNDLSSMVEAPTGSDPAPSFPEGTSFGTALAGGAGWVNYFVHGRADGFVVRSAGIMEWPRSYVFTNGAGGDGNGYLNLAPSSTLSGIHLSAACDQGGFDLNSAPYSSDVGESVAEKLLFMPGGAAAFVGQSRWGWVSTSYKLVQKFYDYVNNPSTPNHVGIYQTLSKLAYSSFRDLVYGNNLYGDPEMPVWKSAPLSLSMVSPEVYSAGANSWNLRTISGASGVAGVTVTIAIGDSVWVVGQSGADGALSASVTLPVATSAILTASKIGYRVWADTLPLSIISGIFDDGDAVPVSHLTISNYPNPFNSATELVFSLPSETRATIHIYDILGRRVRTLHDEVLPAGAHRGVFDGTADDGQALASGVYYARISAAGLRMTRALVLIK
jgi:hypothetical protein